MRIVRGLEICVRPGPLRPRPGKARREAVRDSEKERESRVALWEEGHARTSFLASSPMKTVSLFLPPSSLPSFFIPTLSLSRSLSLSAPPHLPLSVSSFSLPPTLSLSPRLMTAAAAGAPMVVAVAWQNNHQVDGEMGEDGGPYLAPERHCDHESNGTKEGMVNPSKERKRKEERKGEREEREEDGGGRRSWWGGRTGGGGERPLYRGRNREEAIESGFLAITSKKSRRKRKS